MGIRRRTAWSGLVTLALVGGAAAQVGTEDLQIEDRARALGRRLRCPVCQGEPIDESGSDFAARVRAEIRQGLAEGRSDEAIVEALVARYGHAIDGRPPFRGWGMALWALGPLAVLAGLGLAWTSAPRRRGLGRRPVGR